MKHLSSARGAFLLLLLLYMGLQQPYLWFDFWNDELYTLRYFALRPFSVLLADYHVPNNHIFFNLLTRLYLLAAGETDFYALLDHPARLRLLPLGYALLSLAALYRTGRSFFSTGVALVAVLILATTLPYLNFALQIRGYGLSTLLLLLLLLSSWHYEQRPGWPIGSGIALTAALLMYTMPSNVYFLISLGAFWAGRVLAGGQARRPALQIGLWMLLGLGLSLLAYLPVFDQVFRNPYVSYEAFRLDLLRYYVPGVALDFLAGRWPLLLLALAGLVLARAAWRPYLSRIVLLLCLFALPFLIAYVLGNPAPKRVFLPLAPVLALMLAIGIAALRSRLPDKPWLGGLLFLLLGAYCAAAAVQARGQAEDRLLEDIKTGGRSQDLTHQYYSAHYRPLEEVGKFAKQYGREGQAVSIIGCEPHGIRYYLEKEGIAFDPDGRVDSLLLVHDTVYVFSSRPLRVLRAADYHQAELLSPELSYHSLLWLTKDTSLSPQAHKLNRQQPYSLGVSLTYPLEGQRLIVRLHSRFEPGQAGVLVFDIKRDGENIHWEKVPLADFYQKGLAWMPVQAVFQLPEGLLPGDELQIYAWSDQGGSFDVKGLWVERE